MNDLRQILIWSYRFAAGFLVILNCCLIVYVLGDFGSGSDLRPHLADYLVATFVGGIMIYAVNSLRQETPGKRDIIPHAIAVVYFSSSLIVARSYAHPYLLVCYAVFTFITASALILIIRESYRSPHE
jgi:hypothetical protein